MEFHISRSLRDRLKLDDLLFSYTGNVVFANVAASRRLAQKLNEIRGAETNPERTVNAGALFAMGLIDELNHALVARYRREIDPSVLTEAVRWFEKQAGPEAVERLLRAFTEQFPNMAVYRGELSAAEWLRGETEGLPNREAALEELMMLWLSNSNPAFLPYRELFEDSELKKETAYLGVTSELPNYFSTRPPIAPEVGSLLDALRAPLLASPDSLTGQLEFIRENWPKYLGQDLRNVLLAIDVLREEDLAIWMRFHPPGPDQFRHGVPGRGSEGFVGDEFVGFDKDFGSEETGSDGLTRRRYAPGYQTPLHEYEAFSADQAWMPNVVLMAKSTYVWLEQLSKKYLRHIYRLDQIPDEELKLLADRGITALWLIGLWERSTASRTIKRLRGHGDAVASAYSLKGYEIAEDLGGRSAYERLRERAAAVGLRLASDMVPNHMGLDSDWVIEHPDWFLFRWESPFPVYRFEGPDLSTDSRVEIKIEDHYYEQTDAAVVFRLRHYHEGTTRFVYHGNDGTTFAWNDTAQLDYSKAVVREHVIQTILHVARMFPIIRFDAAMVLAKRHVQRLWFPLPGAGGSIPSRAENAISQEEFDAMMPHEFWREVVDRVAAEVPGTLLLAEAFWLLEGYFVRTLGMHRVYNSAFMIMLRDEENAKYRSYLKKTIEFDPDILKRYVNFMSNPDERTAIDQFGSGDKFFGVCTLLATLPGLPMFSHGQIEGYTERYGMEFKQARMDENPDEGLIARHQHEIAPLLHNRRLFAESENFTLYDFWTDDGTVDENVFAYSNRLRDQRALIVYNNRYESTRGTIHVSAAAMDKWVGELRQKSLAEGLALPADDSLIVAYRDTKQNLEYLRRVSQLREHGLRVDLRGYQSMVLLDWCELRPTAEEPWDTLCDALHGEGVPSVARALAMARLRPLHEALRQVLSLTNIDLFVEAARERADADEVDIVSVEGAEAPGDDARITEESTDSDEVLSVYEPEISEKAVDSCLDSFVTKCEFFYEQVLEFVPEIRQREDVGSADVEGMPSDRERYRNGIAEMVPRAVELIAIGERLEERLPPSTVSVLLPFGKSDPFSKRIWAPVLAWIALRNVGWREKSAALFDALQLRYSLAEVFSSLGIEGEDIWRAAAQVRILLLAGDAGDAFHREDFWMDPDVRWLTGVNESEGRTYFNQEAFEELLGWLSLPLWMEAADEDVVFDDVIKAIAAAIEADCFEARRAGFDLGLYLRGWEFEAPDLVEGEGLVFSADLAEKDAVSDGNSLK